MAGSFDRKKFDYSAAATQLYDEGECRDPDEIYEYTTEQGLRSFLGDYGLRFENYYDRPPRGDKRAYNEWVKEHEKKDEEEESDTDTGCVLTSACVRLAIFPTTVRSSLCSGLSGMAICGLFLREKRT